MGAQSFSTDIVGNLNSVTSFAREETLAKLKAGAEAAVDVAKKTGSAQFIAETEAHLEGANALIKKFSSLCDCCDRYAEQNRKLEEALG